MGNTETDFRFQIQDYAILLATLLLSAGFGLYVSLIKHKQSSVAEYFLAGRNVNLVLVLLSYFSSYAAGGMTILAIETYLFGAQTLLFIFVTPLVVCFVYYLMVPVFYRMNSISMLKYFEFRFGRAVYFISLLEIVILMLSIGSINVYVASVVIQQVSTLSTLVSASIMTIVCIIYSTLGGMRGIIVADAIQAVVMIIALVFIFIMGIIKSGGPKAVWDINQEHDRFQLFNMSFDPTIRHTFWTAVVGYGFFNVSHVVTNQTLLQRCLMAPNLKSAQKLASIGSMMTYIYMFFYQSLGVTIFAFYKGCNVVHTGLVENIDQVIPYFAMEILHNFPCFPGVFFSGILCATLSTISSLLNSISAVIMVNITAVRPNISDKTATLLCKLFVVAFGGLMSLGVVLLANFQNAAQASIILISNMAGPIFALYCIGILCPQANGKVVAASLVMAAFSNLWTVIGSIVTSPVIVTSSFSNNCTDTSFNKTINVDQMSSNSNIDAYFPLSKVSYMYICTEGIAVTIISFIVISTINGMFRKTEEEKPVSQLTLDLIPHCVKRLQLKMSRRMRRMLLCDVYGDANYKTEEYAMNQQKSQTGTIEDQTGV